MNRPNVEYPPLRGIRRMAARAAHFVVLNWPLSTKQRGIGRVYWALIPWAGLWAYHPDGGAG